MSRRKCHSLSLACVAFAIWSDDVALAPNLHFTNRRNTLEDARTHLLTELIHAPTAPII